MNPHPFRHAPRAFATLSLALALGLSIPAAAQSPTTARIDTAALAGAASFDQFIVKYRQDSALARSPTRVANAIAAAGVRAGLRASHVRRLGIGAEVVRVERPLARAEAAHFMQMLAADDSVQYVEPDLIQRAFSTPNDTDYGKQWDLFEAKGGIGMPAAWDKASGANVVVAVIDTGVFAHSELAGKILPGYDFITDADNARDGDGRDADASDPGDWFENNECGELAGEKGDSSWHGTHVAGTIAALTNNSKGVAGVAPKAKILPVRVLGKCGGRSSDIFDAIVWSAGGSVPGVPVNSNPAEVINMSLGGKANCSAAYQEAINTAVGRGTTIVAAAGNSRDSALKYTPGNCANVVNVAATNRIGALAIYSNWGQAIDVAAPGGEFASSTNRTSGIWSTLNTGLKGPEAESYAYYQGTSMAAPHVAGLVALMQSCAPKTPAQVESILKSTARPAPGGCSGGCGAGIVDAPAALATLGTCADDGDGGDGNELKNGVPVTGLTAATGQSLAYTMTVPGGQPLRFALSGGTGDADLYVKFGSAPTDTSYDCRPYLGGNNEACDIASSQAGTYHVRIKAYQAFTGATLLGSTSVVDPVEYSNATDFAIPDMAAIESPITVANHSGKPSAGSRITVDIKHTYIGDLRVDLVSPSGRSHVLHNRSGGSADNIAQAYTVDLSSEPTANGVWKLRVYDGARGDTGMLDKWALRF